MRARGSSTRLQRFIATPPLLQSGIGWTPHNPPHRQPPLDGTRDPLQRVRNPVPRRVRPGHLPLALALRLPLEFARVYAAHPRVPPRPLRLAPRAQPSAHSQQEHDRLGLDARRAHRLLRVARHARPRPRPRAPDHEARQGARDAARQGAPGARARVPEHGGARAVHPLRVAARAPAAPALRRPPRAPQVPHRARRHRRRHGHLPCRRGCRPARLHHHHRQHKRRRRGPGVGEQHPLGGRRDGGPARLALPRDVRAGDDCPPRGRPRDRALPRIRGARRHRHASGRALRCARQRPRRGRVHEAHAVGVSVRLLVQVRITHLERTCGR